VLLAFRGENVRSFRDPFELSMLASARAEERFVREVSWREEGRPLKVLPVAGIFGANASGKSNALRALNDMQLYVLTSFQRPNPAGGLRRSPFRLDPAASSAPSRYEIDLVLEDVRHEYGFLIDDERVVEEWAYRYPRGRAALLFHRTLDGVEIGSQGRSQTREITKLLRPDALFLSTAALANHPLLLSLYDWFKRNILLAESGNRALRQAITATALQTPQMREQIMMLLHAADLGITDARTREIDTAAREQQERAARLITGEEEQDERSESEEVPPWERLAVTLLHSGIDGAVELDPSEESLGTLVWFGLLATVVHALTRGTVFLADELDASLHPALVAQLVRLFQQPQTNPLRAQLIFNSHDTTILGDSGEDRLLGRDQVWFTEKQHDGSTRLYPLLDLDPRKHEAIGRRYLAGRYGATPILSDPEFDLAGEQVTTGD
jgi:hypothetical protein